MRRAPGEGTGGPWEKRPEIKELAEQLRKLSHTGAVLVIDNDSFDINVAAVYDLPEDDHWSTLDDAYTRLDPPKIEGANMPHDLIAALGLLLGFGSESV